MPRRVPLTIAQREAIYFGKLAGKRLQDLAAEVGCTLGCARKWWRIGRDQGLEGLRRQGRNRDAPGCLSKFDSLVAERTLYWKRLHPKRGASRILLDLERDPLLQGLCLPKPRTLARYFRSKCPELLQSHNPRPPKPPKAGHVHEIWQIDGKEAVPLANGTLATVLDAREPIACICLGAFAHEVQTQKAWRKLDLREIQADLRKLFTKWGLPKGIQTDRENVYGALPTEAFPTLFTLWLTGLGIQHHLSRPAQPTDQAHVERNHKTIFDWLHTLEPLANLEVLQAKLDEACYMHNEVLPSRAGNCNGRIPIEAHPEVCHPRRPYHLGIELALFDLARVDEFLSRLSWSYKVSKVGQFRIARERYSVGKAYANQYIDARFEIKGRYFAFYDGNTGEFIKRSKAKGLDVATITGFEIPPEPPPTPIQLSFPI